jgi:hypothetical protein
MFVPEFLENGIRTWNRNIDKYIQILNFRHSQRYDHLQNLKATTNRGELLHLSRP